MKTRYWLTTFFVSCFFASTCHAATTSGVMRFTGLVFLPASASIAFDKPSPSKLEQSRRVYSLSEAQAKLSSDVLDYFGTYAAKNAKMVSVTYL